MELKKIKKAIKNLESKLNNQYFQNERELNHLNNLIKIKNKLEVKNG